MFHGILAHRKKIHKNKPDISKCVGVVVLFVGLLGFIVCLSVCLLVCLFLLLFVLMNMLSIAVNTLTVCKRVMFTAVCQWSEC